ncbi:MAG TPA: sterol desaturase family protein [Sediminibacterium sp.]|nr:sterol desaturase family protein [Sediminibacterium sp.]
MFYRAFFQTAWLIGGRYLLLAGASFCIWYLLRRNDWFYQKIQSRFPKNSDYLREILYSLLTIAIFSAVAVVFLYDPHIAPHTTRYKNIADHGWWYFWLVFPVLFLIHDTYFYFLHRLMHHPRLFKWFHLVHHRSTNPSPWAAYAFHPLEALVEVGILIVFLFTIPVHRLHLMVFFLVMILYNVYGHLGYELYPKGFSKSRLGRWINTAVNHNQHHQYFTGNYGLYFLFWYRIFGTIREDYDDRFEEVKNRQPVG